VNTRVSKLTTLLTRVRVIAKIRFFFLLHRVRRIVSRRTDSLSAPVFPVRSLGFDTLDQMHPLNSQCAATGVDDRLTNYHDDL